MEINEKTLMRDVLIDFLRKTMTTNPKVVVVDADLAKCAGTIALEKEFPDRALNVGIAEANMAGIAAGLSTYGYIPFITSFAPFASRRIADQAMISICYAKQNVKIVGTDPGIAAQLNGGTHMPFEDMAIYRAIPDILLYEPTDAAELNAALPKILDYPKPVYIRMHRKNPRLLHDSDCKFDLMRAEVLRKGIDITFVASGIMVETALDAAAELEKEEISAEVICCPVWKPLDTQTIINSFKKTGCALTLENHNVNGGLGSAVAEAAAENYPVPMYRIGVREKFGEVGKIDYLRKVYNLEVSDVVEHAKKVLDMKK